MMENHKTDRSSRRSFLGRIAAGGALAATAGIAACVPPFGMKVSKAQANYRDQPNGNQRCADCMYFKAPNGCSVVQGLISPNGWSRYYKARA